MKLYDYVQRIDAVPRADLELALDDLIAAAFCLWRAVFLAHAERHADARHRARTNFLSNLAETNAIAFSDDRSNSSWSVTFYLENAAHRTASASLHLSDYFSGEQIEYHQTIQYKIDPSIEKIQRDWEEIHSHLNRFVDFFLKTAKALGKPSP